MSREVPERRKQGKVSSTNSYLRPVQELSTLGRGEEKRRMSSSKRPSTSRPDGEKASQVVGSYLYSTGVLLHV